jgi:hypothetical protein
MEPQEYLVILVPLAIKHILEHQDTVATPQFQDILDILDQV